MSAAIDIPALRALLAKGTPLPWTLSEYGNVTAPGMDHRDNVEIQGFSLACGRATDLPLINRDKIVAAVNALPALLDEGVEHAETVGAQPLHLPVGYLPGHTDAALAEMVEELVARYGKMGGELDAAEAEIAQLKRDLEQARAERNRVAMDERRKWVPANHSETPNSSTVTISAALSDAWVRLGRAVEDVLDGASRRTLIGEGRHKLRAALEAVRKAGGG